MKRTYGNLIALKDTPGLYPVNKPRLEWTNLQDLKSSRERAQSYGGGSKSCFL